MQTRNRSVGKSGTLFLAALALLLTDSPAWADASISQNREIAQSSKAKKRLSSRRSDTYYGSGVGRSKSKRKRRSKGVKQPWILEYFADFQGPSISQPLEGSVPTVDGSDGDALNIYNELKLGYRLSRKAHLRIYPRFTVFSGEGGGAKLGDLRAGAALTKVARAGLYQLTELSLDFDFPTSQSSQDKNLAFATRLKQKQKLRLGKKSDWNIGLETQEIFNLYASVSGGEDIRFVAKPWISYNFSDSFNSKIETEFVLGYTAKSNPTFSSNTPQAKWLWSWQAFKALNLTPYLKVFPSKMSLQTTSVGIEATASIL